MTDRPWLARVAYWAAVACIFVVAFLLRAQTLWSPIEGGFHDLGVRQALAARNLLAYGVVETRGAMVLNGGPSEPAELEAYSHHPTLLVLILAGSFAVFGDTLPVYRLTLIVISLAGIALLMRILFATYGKVASLLAGWIFAVCPMSAFFATGGDVLGEGLNLFILAGLACRILCATKPGRGRFAAELGCYALAGLYDWVGLFAFGIPLVDAVIGKAPRGGFKRGFLALGAAALVFVLVFAWARVVVPGRFPETDDVGGALTKWTALRVVRAFQETPDLMRFTLAWFFSSQMALWTLPIIGGAALGLAGALIAALRGRFAESGGRILVLMLVPGVAFAIGLLGMFLMHTYAPIILVPAFAGAAAAFGGFLCRLGVIGKCAAAAWALWCGWQGMTGTRSMFESTAFPSLHHAAVEAAAHSAPDTLLATYHARPWVIAFSARRNVVAAVTSPHGHPMVHAYLQRHPGASVVFLLPPMQILPPDHPARAGEIERYDAIEQALEARSRPRTVAGWRIYRIQ